jgi:hypothetical protein
VSNFCVFRTFDHIFGHPTLRGMQPTNVRLEKSDVGGDIGVRSAVGEGFFAVEIEIPHCALDRIEISPGCSNLNIHL